MDTLLLKKYGDITYQRKDFDNLYSYIKLLNYEIELFLERKRIDFNAVIPLLNYSNQFLNAFGEYFYDLNEKELLGMPYLLKNSYSIIERLRENTLYTSKDEFYIIKYIDFIYNVKYHFNFFGEQEELLFEFKKLEDNMLTPEYILLNTEQPILEQVFYNPQILTGELKEYYKNQILEGNYEVNNILLKDLEESKYFPTPNFFLWGINKKLEVVIDRFAQLGEYFETMPEQIKNDLKVIDNFNRFNSTKNYKYQLLEDKGFPFIEDVANYKNDLLYNNLLYTLSRNFLIPEDFFAAIENELFKEDYPADISMKYITMNYIGMGKLVESTLLTMSNVFTEDIFAAKMDKIEKNFDIKIETQDNTDLIAGLLFKLLLKEKITLDEIDKIIPKDDFENILKKYNLIKQDLKNHLRLVKNNVIKNNDELLDNYIKVKTQNSKDLTDVMEFLDSYLTGIPKKIEEPISLNQKLLNELDTEKQNKQLVEAIKNNTYLKNDKLVTALSIVTASDITQKKIENEKTAKLSFNKKPDDTLEKYVGVIVKQNLKNQLDVAKNLAQMVDVVPLLKDVNGGEELQKAVLELNKIDDSTINKIPDEGKLTLPKNIVEKNGVLKNEGEPIIKDVDTTKTVNDINKQNEELKDSQSESSDASNNSQTNTDTNPTGDSSTPNDGTNPVDGTNPTGDSSAPNDSKNKKVPLPDDESEQNGKNKSDTDPLPSPPPMPPTPPKSKDKHSIAEFMANLSKNISKSFDSWNQSLESAVLKPMEKAMEWAKNAQKQVQDWVNKQINERMQKFTEKINEYITKIQDKIQGALNKLQDFLNNAIAAVQAILDGISKLLSTLLKALCALLCLLGMILNIGDTIKDTISNFLGATQKYLDSAIDSLESLVEGSVGVLGDIMDSLGLSKDNLCNNSNKSFLESMKDELTAYAKEQYAKFMESFASSVDKALNCKFKAPTFNFGSFKKFHFNFKLKKLSFKIPKC